MTTKRSLKFCAVTPHKLRHSHATQMLINGSHPKIVSERLGYASISVTLDLYGHIIPGLQEDAVQQFNESFLGVTTSKL